MSALHSLHALKRWKGERIADKLMRPAAGLEAEFSLLVDGVPRRPEDIFGDPTGFITVPLAHRTGRSFQLPNGGAVYFDTGVIEIATPVMELERGCFGRLARSLHAGIAFVRNQLDGWERRSGRHARLQGFSAHYNVSVDAFNGRTSPAKRIDELAWWLAHVLPAPVMLLATNRRSTGVGVRPRPRRIEVTVDFSPDPGRMAATGAVIAGIVLAGSLWPDLSLDTLRRRRIPSVLGFAPRPHTSRRGWLARFDSYPANPFDCVPDAKIWETTTHGAMSLRAIALRVFRVFRDPIRRMADPPSYRTAWRILSGATASWLDQDERPATYEDVGREGACTTALERLGLSDYERVALNAIGNKPLLLGDERWWPIRMRGWSRVVFQRERDGARTVLPIDTLVARLDEWK